MKQNTVWVIQPCGIPLPNAAPPAQDDTEVDASDDSLVKHSTPLMSTGWGCDLGQVWLKLSTISLVFIVLSCRWSEMHHFRKSSIRLRYFSSFPFLIHPTLTVSSENFCLWHNSELCLNLRRTRQIGPGRALSPVGTPCCWLQWTVNIKNDKNNKLKFYTCK